MVELVELVKRVKRGVKVLDRKIPNWRTVLRRHQEEFRLSNLDYCILGTLEHHSGRMRQLNQKRVDGTISNDGYTRAIRRLNLATGTPYGFDLASSDSDAPYGSEKRNDLWKQLEALWRGEFEK